MRANVTYSAIFFVLAGAMLSVLAGLMSAVLPWWFVLIVFAPPFAVAMGWRWPVLSLVGMLLVVYGVIPVGKPKLIDVVVVMFIGFVLILRRQEIGPILHRFKALWGVLALFVVYVIVNTVYSKSIQGNAPEYIYMESTSMIYWAAMFPVALLARDERSAELLLKTLVVVSVIISFFSIAQSVLGMRLMFSGDNRVAIMDAATGGISGVARSTVPGTPLVVFSYLLALATLLRGAGTRWIWMTVLVITGLGLFVSFGRALWAMTALASLLVAALSGWRAFGRFILYSILALAVITVLAELFKPDLIPGVINRITSVRQEGSTNSSLGWRFTENSYAIPQILQHLWIGMGLGAEYKPRLVDMRMFSEQTRYIHNGYLYVLLKMGIVGAVAYLAQYLYLLYKCFEEGKHRQAPYTPRVAFGALLLMTLALNATQPEFFAAPTIISLAVLAPVALSTRLKWR